MPQNFFQKLATLTFVDEKDNKAKQYIENNNSTTASTSYTYYPNRMSQSASQTSFTNLRPPPKSHTKVSQKKLRTLVIGQ